MKYNQNKILYIRPILDSYGVSKVLLHLAVEMKKKGYKVCLASDNLDGFKMQLEKMGIECFILPLSPYRKNIVTFIHCFFKLALLVKREKIDLIHSHHRWSSFISFFVSKLLNIPLITTYHGIHRAKRFLTLWGDAVISVSEDAKIHLEQFFRLSPDRITVIANGISIPESEDIISSERGLITDSVTYYIANIARLSVEKDQTTLLLAMRMLLDKLPEAKLMIVGKGPLEEQLKILAEKVGIARNVNFCGEVEDVRSILKRMDCLVLSSLTEGFPLAVLEALAYGKPAVATRVGDIPKVVIDGKTGYLVTPNDPEELATALIKVLSNRELAIAMGKNGRELVLNNYGVAKMANETEKIYLSLLRHRNSLPFSA